MMDDDLIQRLRDCCEPLSDAAADEIELLRAEVAELRRHAERVEAWQRAGEQEFCAKRTTWHFGIGAWWADRPWRQRLGAAMTGETR